MSTLVLCIGDSKTAGNPPGLAFGATWPGQMQSVLQAASKSVVVLNTAVSGSTAGTAGHSPWLPTATGALGGDWFAGVEVVDDVRYPAYVAMVALTHNDLAFGSSAAFIEDRLRAIGATLAQRGYRVVLTTALPSAVITGSSETDRLAINAWIMGRTHGYFASDFTTIPETALTGNTTWYVDGTHPTAALDVKLGAKAAADLLALGLV